MRLYDVATNHMAPTDYLKIVSLGGGTGLSTFLRGIKHFTPHLTAVVTVADDGGGSGTLRQEMGMLPPGDIRNCILALAQTEPIMEKLLSYRFAEGSLAGQSFGNLFLAAMAGISNGFEEAVKRMSDVLKVTGRVLPVTLTDVRIEAILKDGTALFGESNIPAGSKYGDKQIDHIRLHPPTAPALPEVLEAIKEADIITMGPGSLFTSIVPNLLADGVAQALKQTAAPIYYICNIMTQPGETDGMTAFDHVAAIHKHVGEPIIDHCLANNFSLEPAVLATYAKDDSHPVVLDSQRFEAEGVTVVADAFVQLKNGLIRHDYDKASRVLVDHYRSSTFVG